MEYIKLNFYSTELSREKDIYVYLPKNYESSDKRYPVLYMHDGQNLFDDEIAYMKRSWRIADVYKNNPDMKELIIVGINSDDVARADELIPYKFEYKEDVIWGGDAFKYLDFITKTVKPLIDQKYRTLKEPKHTGIMGSSFGGVNSICASVAYSDYFTRFGCVSNALMFKFYDQLKEDIINKDYTYINKFYMDCGDSETPEKEWNDAYIKYNDDLYDVLKNKIDNTKLKYEIIKGGIHHESSWETRFKDIVEYLFND